MDTDILIVGAGPGGLQLGYCLAKKGRSFCILERGSGAGTFFKQYPRHRKLISVNKVHTGFVDERRLRFDWNSLLSGEGPHFGDASQEYFPSADEMVAYLQRYADAHIANIEYNADVETIFKRGDHFHVVTRDGRHFTARAVVMATGVSKPYLPQIPGLALADHYANFDINPDVYTGLKVLVIGKGNSAFETADSLVPKAALIHLVSPSPIKLAWNTHFPGDLRAVNNNFLDTYQLKIQNALLDAKVRRLRATPDGKVAVSLAYSHAAGEVEDVVYDRVICCTGFGFDDSCFAADSRPCTEINGRFPSLTAEFESVNVPGLYFVGTLTQSLDYRKTNSAFIHGFRYNAQVLSLILDNKLFGVPLPAVRKPLDPNRLAAQILCRINHSSAQWQQFGFIGDAAAIQRGHVTYYEDLPVQYIHQSEISRAMLYAVVTLEFGAHRGDVFSIQRSPDVDSAAGSVFLHPVVRIFSQGGVLLRKLHLLENLFGEWMHPQLHLKPLQDFLHATLIEQTNIAEPSPRSPSQSDVYERVI